MTQEKPPVINTPRSLQDLKALYQQFYSVLTPENQQLLGALIGEIEKGPDHMDSQNLQNLANRMQTKAQEAEDALKNMK